MDFILSKISEFFLVAKNTVFTIFGNINIFDILDIIILTVVVYKILEFCIDTRAKTLLKGIILIIVMYLVSRVCGMIGINWLLEKIVTYSFIILAIIFQPELRRALESVGRSNLKIFGKSQNGTKEEYLKTISVIAKSVSDMSKEKIGALIVIENDTPLGEIANTGTIVDATVSVPVLCNLFYPKSPLHDGAVVISDNRIKAAGAILPLTENPDLDPHLGTRHRAAVGMSENSDAVVVVVSEETGNISLAYKGRLKTKLNIITLQQKLSDLLLSDLQENDSGFFRTRFGSLVKNKEDGENE